MDANPPVSELTLLQAKISLLFQAGYFLLRNGNRLSPELKVVAENETALEELLNSCPPNISDKLQILDGDIPEVGVAQEVISMLETALRAQRNRNPTPIANRSNVSYQTKATEDAWLTDYVGEGHKLLLNRIKDITNQNGTSYYAHILPIVQSSGMGKSRAVHELSKLIFTIPICLRNSSLDSGYPKGDEDLVNAFKNAFDKQYTEDYTPRSHCAAIFTCIFRAFAKELDESKCSSPMEWCMRLNQTDANGNTVRQRLYAGAYKEYITEGRHKYDGATMQSAFQDLKHIMGITKMYKTGTEERVIVYIDECQCLTSQVVVINDRKERKPLDFVSFALDECRTAGLFGIFLSTNSIFSDLPVPSNVLPSAREVTIGQNLHSPPFVWFGFDLWNGKPIIREGESTLHDVCQMSFLARFGRPLWWTRITEPSGSINIPILRQLNYFAAVKLLGSSSAQVLSQSEVMFAVLSARLCIDLQPARESAGGMGQKLVANHLRVIYYIPDHKSYMLTGSPSEPVIAEAAAGIWNNTLSLDATRVKFDPLKALTTVIGQGLLAKGDRGELVARFIFLRAQDIAIRSLQKIEPALSRIYDSCAPFSEAVPLWTFFSALFHEDQQPLLSKVVPRNRPNGMKMEEACKNKYVRFNHFACAADTSMISTMGAFMALARGNAWQCHARQEAIDIIIPVFIKESDGSKLGRETVTFILCQVKNTKAPRTVHFSAEHQGLALFRDRGQPSADIPYFVIIFNFGGPSTRPVLIPHDGKTKKSHPDDPRPEGKPCYWLDVRGCSSQIFNPDICLPSSEEALHNILGTFSLCDEAPKSAWEHIQRLKPDFGLVPGSLDWVKLTTDATKLVSVDADSDDMDMDES